MISFGDDLATTVLAPSLTSNYLAPITTAVRKQYLDTLHAIKWI